MPSVLFSGGWEVDGSAEFWPVEMELFPSSAFFAAHRALIAADICARRSGERLTFFLGMRATFPWLPSPLGIADFCPTNAEGLPLSRLLVARAADFLAAFNAFAASASCSLRLNFASFCGPSRRRFSSCSIFRFNFFSFISVLLLSAEWHVTIAVRVNDKILHVSRTSSANWPFAGQMMARLITEPTNQPGGAGFGRNC
jgi:hypothetical protein